MDSKNDHAWYSLGLSYENLGQFTKAIDMYKKSLKYDENAPTTYRISLSYFTLDFDKAIEYGERTYETIKKDPTATEENKEFYKEYVRILKNIKNQTEIEDIVEANIELIDSTYTYPILHKEIMIEGLMNQVEKDSNEYYKLVELKNKIDNESK